jgi:23S rRNA pseudouridine2605 synthase
MSVGRLDMGSEGLLLLTNDGALARRLELPATGWVRRYRVRVHGRVEPRRLEALAGGVTVSGVRYGPITATLDRQQGANAWLTIALAEGKNREIRRVCEYLGWTVGRLIRTSFGPFQLGNLARGAIDEVPKKVLREQLGGRADEAGAGAGTDAHHRR